jgi:hypothetical protein
MAEARARAGAVARHAGKVATGAIGLGLARARGGDSTVGGEPGLLLPFPFPFPYSAGTSGAGDGSAAAGACPCGDAARNRSNSTTGSGRLTQ